MTNHHLKKGKKRRQNQSKGKLRLLKNSNKKSKTKEVWYRLLSTFLLQWDEQNEQIEENVMNNAW